MTPKEGWATVGIRKELLLDLKALAAVDGENATSYLEKVVRERIKRYGTTKEFQETREKFLEIARLKKEI